MKRVAVVTGVVALLLAGAPSIATGNPSCERSETASPREHNPHCAEQPVAERVLDGHVADWVGVSSGLGGTSQVSNGEFVHQDYIYDDFGAQGGVGEDQRAKFSGTTTGTARYPTDEDRFANNAADLFQLRLTTVGDEVWGLVRLNALRQPDTTVAAIAIDTDGDLTDSGGEWPLDAGVATPGADRVITVWADADGTGHGSVVDLDTGTTTAFDDVAVSTADADNAFELELPRSLIGGTTWTIWAGTGLWDGDGWTEVPAGAPTATTPGNGSPTASARLFNVAFRDKETGDYFDDLQAAALEANDISAFAATWSPDAGDDAYVIETGRIYEAVVDQAFSIPPLNEGASYDGVQGRASGGIDAYAQVFDFLGRWQPYGVYLPQGWDPARTWPTLFALHGRGGTQGAFFAFGGGFQRDIGEGHPDDPMVIVTPLGRGRSHYESWGEADVLRVLDDAIPRFAIDTDRISLGGYSMGGLGIYRLATLYPDRWATVVAWAGASSEFTGNWVTATFGGGDGSKLGNGNHMATGDYVQLMGNLRHLPILLLTGTNDEMLPLTGQIAPHKALDDLGYRYGVDVYAGYGHLSWGAFDGWTAARDWIGTRTRQTTPRSIDYRYSDSIADPATADTLGLRYGNAWWVSDLARRDADAADPEDPYRYGSISVTSRAIPADAHTAVRSTEPQASPHPHTRTELTWVAGGPEPIENVLEVELANIAAATIDVDAAGLDPGGLEVTLTTDGPGHVRLRGSFDTLPIVVGPAVVTIDGDGVLVEVLDGGVIGVTFG